MSSRETAEAENLRSERDVVVLFCLLRLKLPSERGMESKMPFSPRRLCRCRRCRNISASTARLPTNTPNSFFGQRNYTCHCFKFYREEENEDASVLPAKPYLGASNVEGFISKRTLSALSPCLSHYRVPRVHLKLPPRRRRRRRFCRQFCSYISTAVSLHSSSLPLSLSFPTENGLFARRSISLPPKPRCCEEPFGSVTHMFLQKVMRLTHSCLPVSTRWDIAFPSSAYP